MLKKKVFSHLGKSDLGWLKSSFHFSFSEYKDFNNMNFGVLRVLNDDYIMPNSGFETHPHNNMEIITYVIDGELTHKDSMGNVEVLKRGEVQYMSAGDRIFHSEHNLNKNTILRLLQIWIIPPKKGLQKQYGSFKFKASQRENKLLPIVSKDKDISPINLYSDINIFVSELKKDKTITHNIVKHHQVYFVQIEGSSLINEVILKKGDALEIRKEDLLNIKALENSHFLFIEMKES